MRRSTFTTVKTEGGLFPADFLQKLTGPSPDVPGLTTEAYHLTGHEKLNEAASRAWNRLLGIWAAFQDVIKDIPETDPATGLTRDKWLLPLFTELGYGRLQPSKAIEIDNRSYPVSHRWQNVPIHLVGLNVGLDRRSAGVAGAARTSPHGLVQELLNRRTESLWGFVSNGLKLRLLRDNRSLTRQAYVEFDLAAMMDGQAFSDFVLLWVLCHESRVEGEPPDTCWLEKWATAAREQGTRALKELRSGVARAIELLGRGFLKHSANKTLLEKLRAGTLDRQDYYRQLLRLIYRLIFLFVSESRELLLTDSASAAAQRYRRYYSLTRLRDLAGRRRGTTHGDLWKAVLLVFRALSSGGCPELGLPALGSFLWSDAATPDLDTCDLANADLLEAIRALAFRLEGGVRRTVDWRNLGSEELGSVYEALLELHPEVNTAGALFSLRIAAGHERKETGSYYTPTSLVESLLDSALDPVLAEAAKKRDPERAILNLRVCDPAAGSGHFLIAAAHRIARRLAVIRTGDAEASPEAVRHALRDVIGHCLYGVDMNPMAVELCKVSLWLEALEPGRPLSFLDHHIQYGNSLLGATPVLLRAGIPDAAFEPIEGDDREYCRDLKRWNRSEREGHRNLFTAEPWERLGDLATGMANLDEIDDSSLEGVREKERRYAEIVRSADYEQGHLLADAWCAAFVWPKTRDSHPIGEDLFRTIERNPMAVAESVRNEIRRIARQHQFFHWHLAFPEVFQVSRGEEPPATGPGWKGGFDVVLGNPPWEKLQTEEIQFFAARNPQIAELSGATRKNAIKALKETDPRLAQDWMEQRRFDAGIVGFIRNSGNYPLAGVGKFNTFALFAEQNSRIVAPTGRAGCILPSGIATDDTTKFLFQHLVKSNLLISLFDFENREAIFPAVHRSYKFCLLTIAGSSQPIDKPAEFIFFAYSVNDLRNPQKRFNLSAADITLLNPNTHTCATFRSRRDADLTLSIYRRIPILLNDRKPDQNLYGARVWRLLNTTDDSGDFVPFDPDSSEVLIPVVEAKTIHQFDHRFASFGKWGEDAREINSDEKASPDVTAYARYYITDSMFRERMPAHLRDKGWFLTVRNIARSTDERTSIAALFPRGASCEHTPYLEVAGGARVAAFLTGVLNSFVLDYVARQKVGGTHLSYFILYQLPVLFPSPSSAIPAVFITDRVLELSYTAWNLTQFAFDYGLPSTPYRWVDERRFTLQCELDAALFHLYLPADAHGDWLHKDKATEDYSRLKVSFAKPRDAVIYIMDTFPIVKRNDEEKFHGEYRTKSVILEIYDRMQHAMENGQPYKTLIDPPPADLSCRHPRKKIGILAFGSLLGDPGDELKPRVAMRIKTKTSFGVEYGRYSHKTRGGAPTLVPHHAGAPVCAEILVLDDDVTTTEAANMLWRRETRKTGTGETYKEGTSENSVLVRTLVDDPCVETLLYTDFSPAGKIPNPAPTGLAERAIRSVEIADDGKDGITYLIDAIKYGIETPLTQAYRDEIFRLTNTHSLQEALSSSKEAASGRQKVASSE